MKKYVNLFVFVFMIGACLSQGRAQTFLCVCYRIYQKRSDHEVERFGGMDVLQHCIHE